MEPLVNNIIMSFAGKFLKKAIPYVPFFVFFPFSVTPDPYEGSQTSLLQYQRMTDWWGNLAPVAPKLLNLEDWKSWLLFYFVVAFLGFIGLKRLLSLRQEQNYKIRLFRIFIYYLSLLFICQGSRDGIFFALSIFGLSYLLNLQDSKKFTLQSLSGIALASLMMSLGALFKIPIVPIILFAILILLHQIKKKRLSIYLIFTSIACCISIMTFLGDNYLNKTFKIDNSYPQQQVMFYDLTGISCWSASTGARLFAENKIENFLKLKSEKRIICSSLTPNGWDTLRLPYIDSSIEPPLIIVSTNDSGNYELLRNGWITTIRKYPKEWLGFKINLLGQSLVMSNAFSRGKSILNLDWSGLIAILRSTFILPAIILDDLYFLTLAAAFVHLFLVSLQTNDKKQLLHFGFLLVSLMLTSITFVANNGRYVVTILLLYLVFQFRQIYLNPKRS